MAVIEDENKRLTVPARSAVARVFGAHARSVREAREVVVALAERAGAAPGRVCDIRLAVSEAATNVVMHAYQEQEHGGHFRLLAVVGGEHLVILIEDDGCGLSCPAQRPGLGMGVKLMRKTAEQALFLTRQDGGSSVHLRFRLSD
jgi:serine/threonine-protein kinase RsbW